MDTKEGKQGEGVSGGGMNWEMGILYTNLYKIDN